MASPQELTRHVPLPRRYFGRDILSGREGRGYTGMDLFKFYGLVTGMLFALAYVYTRYLDLFTEATKPDASAGFKLFTVFFSAIPLLLGAVAVEGFIWWAGGALVGYTRWQLTVPPSPRFWRWFWVIVLNFYAILEFDPLDKIHPTLSRTGLAYVPNVIQILSSGLFRDGHLRPPEELLFQFQLGYAVLWFLFWFLVVLAHYSYLVDGLREVWFYAKRVNRYGASVLTGFRGTLAVARSAPVTREWPRTNSATLLTPYLNVDALTSAQADSILAADASGGIVRAPQQATALLVDLGSFVSSPALAALTDSAGSPLLGFEQVSAPPTGNRESLVVPLRRRST